MKTLKQYVYKALRRSERFFKTDMVYLAKGGFWLSFEQVTSSILAFALSIAFAHLLSKEIYGNYQFALSVASIIGALTLTGMNTAVTQATARGFERVFKDSLKSQLTWAFIPLITGLAISYYYFSEGNITLSLSIIIISLLLPVLNAFNTYNAFLIGKKDFKKHFIYGQFLNLLYTIGMIISLFYIKSAVGLILINYLINTFVTILICIKILRTVKQNDKGEKEALSYGRNLSLANILPAIAAQIDNIVVYHFIGAAQLAIYSFASLLPEKLGGFLRSISTIAFPKLSERTHDDIRQTIVPKVLRLGLVTTFSFIIYILLAPFIFKLFFPQYIVSISYSLGYAIVAALSIIASFPVTALFALRNQKIIYIFNIFNPLFNITIVIIFAYLYGIWGVIIAKVVGSLWALILSTCLVLHKNYKSTFLAITKREI